MVFENPASSTKILAVDSWNLSSSIRAAVPNSVWVPSVKLPPPAVPPGGPLAQKIRPLLPHQIRLRNDSRQQRPKPSKANYESSRGGPPPPPPPPPKRPRATETRLAQSDPLGITLKQTTWVFLKNENSALRRLGKTVFMPGPTSGRVPPSLGKRKKKKKGISCKGSGRRRNHQLQPLQTEGLNRARILGDGLRFRRAAFGPFGARLRNFGPMPLKIPSEN